MLEGQQHTAAVARRRAGAMCLVAAVATRVKAVAPDGAGDAAPVLTLLLARQARRVTTCRLVGTVVAISEAVAEVVEGYALATVTGVLRGGTESSAIRLVASIPAVNKSITAAIRW